MTDMHSKPMRLSAQLAKRVTIKEKEHDGLKPRNSLKTEKELLEKRDDILKGRDDFFVQQYLAKKTKFDKDEIRALQTMYRAFRGNSKFTKNNHQIDKPTFRDMISSIFKFTDSLMLDRVYHAFDSHRTGGVSEIEWVLGLSALLRGSLDQHISYTYDVYDINGDKSIGREEIQNFLRGSLHEVRGVMPQNEIEEGTYELAELVMKKFDIKRNGNIGYAEYHHVLEHDPLLLELLGECVPRDNAALPFVALLNGNPRKYEEHFSIPGDLGWRRERERYSETQGPHYHHDGFLQEYDSMASIVKPSDTVLPTLSTPSTSQHRVPRDSITSRQWKSKPTKKPVMSKPMKKYGRIS